MRRHASKMTLWSCEGDYSTKLCYPRYEDVQIREVDEETFGSAQEPEPAPAGVSGKVAAGWESP